MDASGPTVAELNQQVDDILTQPFISDGLMECLGEKQPSRLLVISAGSDGGMSELLKNKDDKARVTETVGDEDGSQNLMESQTLITDRQMQEERELSQREGKQVVVVLDEEDDRGKDEMEEERETLSAEKKTMESIPRNLELALLCRNVVETSLLTGHAVRRALNVDAT
ncbi:hypothetical protein Dimus_029366 [Dionaea muscipula]